MGLLIIRGSHGTILKNKVYYYWLQIYLGYLYPGYYNFVV